MVVHLKKRLTQATATLKPCDSARQHQLGVDMELVAQLCLPLLGQVWWTEHR